MKNLLRKINIILMTFVSSIMVFPAAGQAFFTGFEGLTDTDGEFVIVNGDPQVTATFIGGESKSVGNPADYHSGAFSFMVDTETTASISFSPGVSDVNFFIRDESSSTGGIVIVLDEDNNVLETINSTNADWTEVDVVAPADSSIAMIMLDNPGTNGYLNLDDLSAQGVAVESGLEDPIPDPVAFGGVRVRLQPVAVGLTAPNWGINAPDLFADRMFVSDQSGKVWQVSTTNGGKKVFLDVANLLVPLGAFGDFDERGLLGFAFHPNYSQNGLIYTYTSEPADQVADFLVEDGTVDHHSVVREWHVSMPENPTSVVDPNSSRVLMRIEEPQFNHDGGALNFGPDGFLYVSLGDGGNADDEGDGHGATGNGQNLSNILGSIIRIDPLGSDSVNGQYGIPTDNPFIADVNALDEIWAYGFRNPFRFSFDRLNGKLYVGDVGQNDIEEVDIAVSGGNYGWVFKEGSFFFDGDGENPGFVTDVDPGVPAGLIDPIAEYDHDEGIAIIGGFVYRGSLIPQLTGRYVFGDFSRNFLGNDGRLFYLTGSVVRELRLVGKNDLGLSLLGFGQDINGELYVLANSTGTPFGTTGVVLRIEP
ncbi:MAG: glucose/arabinose dehydrogenase [Paraglaciecola sp.]|jgi:glucose/arabinose dehydrogenase